MAEQKEHPVKPADPDTPAEETSETPEKPPVSETVQPAPRRSTTATRPAAGPAAATRRAIRMVASLVRIVTGLAALVLVLHIIFEVFGGNGKNALVQLTADLAGTLSIGLSDVFLMDEPKLTVAINFGLAALVWLIGGTIVTRLINRLAGAVPGRP